MTPKRINDNVNHPPHYETGKFESIEVMEEVFGRDSVKDFCLCNAFKYLYRCQKKHETPVEDVEKAIWYLNRYLTYCYTTDNNSLLIKDNIMAVDNDALIDRIVKNAKPIPTLAEYVDSKGVDPNAT